MNVSDNITRVHIPRSGSDAAAGNRPDQEQGTAAGATMSVWMLIGLRVSIFLLLTKTLVWINAATDRGVQPFLAMFASRLPRLSGRAAVWGLFRRNVRFQDAETCMTGHAARSNVETGRFIQDMSRW